ncbi:MAG: flavodoxin-dependent (E)-4-hydroxy-3-methylbut-2-enyl-diphosphate synthase [Proteobacteria bacterium]|nr:flavodoxin-dependent (E)-4-hydroxy-3-methylbut-2-enyl-diphosphate synthase [Pseudomonadota bacterium]
MGLRKRRTSKSIRIGNVIIGDGYPVAIQSMVNKRDIIGIFEQIKQLEKSGCDIVRIAIPDENAIGFIPKIKQSFSIPLVADIHFDYKLAIRSIEMGADKIRINPGNIGSDKKVKDIIKAAKDYDVPIRIGVNSGSLKLEYINKYGGPTAKAMVENTLDFVKFFEDNDFTNIVLSLKSSDVITTVKSNISIAKKTEYPIHIGVTEAGPVFESTVRSSIGLGYLLLNGIGDTIRVSITGNVNNEIAVAKEILKNCIPEAKGVRIISCPTCGRTEINLENLINFVKDATKNIDTPITIAVMGCIVNGPGEAKHADLGIAMDHTDGIIFRKGKIVKRVQYADVRDSFIEELNSLIGEKNGTYTGNTKKFKG